jgi:LacI family transcriptional regulator
VSLRRLAANLGLSVTTVSRALDGYGDVAAATRERVLAEAERTGYQPNRAARALRQGRAGAIGVVLPTPAGHFADPFFLQLLAAIGPCLAKAGLDLLVMAAPPGPEEIRAYRHLVEGRRIDGVLLARTRVADERVAWLQAHGVPFVTHGRTGAARPHAWVDVDGAAAFGEAVRLLAAHGHRRMALINAPRHYNFARDRAAGWRAALAALGLDDALRREAEPTEANGQSLAAALLARPAAPTALVCATDRLAVGALNALAEAGLGAGRDVSVTGYDDLPVAGWVRPGLTSFAQPTEEVAVLMVDMLLKLLAGADPAGLNALLKARLVVRDSAGPAPSPQVPGTNPDGGRRDTTGIRAS